MHLLGMISLGQALFFGMGAYCSGVLNAYVGLPPMLTIPLGALLGGGLSTLMLMPVLRLRGLYFAMVTLALTSIMVRIIEATGLLGGTAGLSALDPLPNAWAEVYLAIFSAFACLFGLRRLDRSNYGVVLRGIGENDRAVLSSGVDVFRYKTQALFIGSTIGAFAGAFMTHTICCVGLAAFAMDNSVLPVASVVVGGAGTFAGAMVGAFLLVPLSEFLRAFGEMRIVFYCLILILFIVVAPAGVFPYFQRLYHQTQRVVRTGEKDAV
jgi:branched-chain amino acid transport system permease protein